MMILQVRSQIQTIDGRKCGRMEQFVVVHTNQSILNSSTVRQSGLVPNIGPSVFYYWLILDYGTKDVMQSVIVWCKDHISRVYRVSSVGVTEGSSMGVPFVRRWWLAQYSVVGSTGSGNKTFDVWPLRDVIYLIGETGRHNGHPSLCKQIQKRDFLGQFTIGMLKKARKNL